MPIDHVLPHDLDDEFGPGAEDADTEADIEAIEDTIAMELTHVITEFAEGHNSSVVKDLQPPSTIIRAMATAAAQVLIAFERGYRMGD